MDNNIISTVYNALAEDTDTVAKSRAEMAAADDAINSGRYTTRTIQGEYEPKRAEAKRKMESDATAAINRARALVAQYAADADAMNDLDPAQLTDDIKLLQAGIQLTERDIKTMLKRNAENRTMQQLIMRYAQEHGIESPDFKPYYIPSMKERATAEGLSRILDYYEKWITQPNAREMLDKFFNVKE